MNEEQPPTSGQVAHDNDTPGSDRWQRAPRAPGASWSLYLITAIIVGAVAWATLGGEQNLFSTAPTPVLVEVQDVLAAQPDDSGPPDYIYTVSLPDGARARYRSGRIYRAGDRVTLLYSRGKLTGRILLTTPALDTPRSSGRP